MIPANNGHALLSYYLGLFSIVPCVGLPMAILALRSAKLALQAAKSHPHAVGKSHAYVGAGCGLVGLIFNLIIVAFIIALLVSGKPAHP
jgi:hypothetical protein